MLRTAGFVGVLLIGLFLGRAERAFAFKCRERPSVARASELRDFVFSGRVIWDLSVPDRQQVLVEPLESFKGCLRSWVVVRGKGKPFACAVTFRVGERYLFFTSTPKAGWIHEVWGCDPNVGLEHAKESELALVAERYVGCRP